MSDLTDIQRMIDKGNKAEARTALISILQHDPKNIEAWLILATIIEDPQKKRDCYNQVMKISPNNFEAFYGLSKLDAARLEKSETRDKKSENYTAQNYQTRNNSNRGVSYTTGTKKSSNTCGVVILVVISLMILGGIGQACDALGIHIGGSSCSELAYLYNRALDRGEIESASLFLQDMIDQRCPY